jgi:RHH-type rel operon transcriptional repressor/antitoxin RelB
MLAIRLPPDIEARLEKLAKATGRSKTFYAREAIEEHLADLEDIYLAERRLEDVRARRIRSVPVKNIHVDGPVTRATRAKR